MFRHLCLSEITEHFCDAYGETECSFFKILLVSYQLSPWKETSGVYCPPVEI
ncbi:Uncharacterized protein dnm_085220 [Desulfonema magnum]|uniref:Uncharacterized protein n=1 Tax=Desulfonema magnum TaxID=45655 RepID=A0A975GSY8_9BACT|nr:Uncharacterized protein dnm_085220 [Desulfonema magnum]